MANESGPIVASGVAVGTGEGTGLALLTNAAKQDITLANVPYQTAGVLDRTVTIRGIAYVTATASTLTVRCRQGAGTGGTQVGVSFVAPATAVGTPVPFEFVDTAPVGENYTITVQGSVACTAQIIAHVLGSG